MVASADFRKVPSTPVGPNPSMISLVNLNGTVSGVGRIFDCSNANPKSMWITSAVCSKKQNSKKMITELMIKMT